MDKCVMCERPLRRRRKHVLSKRFLETRRDLVEQLFREIPRVLEITFDGTRSICHACWHSVDAATKRKPEQSPAQACSGSTGTCSFINVEGYTRAANTSRRCMIDDCPKTRLQIVPNSTKVALLSNHNFYVPPNARLCNKHSDMEAGDIAQNVRKRQNGFTPDNLTDIIQIYRTALEERANLNDESEGESE